MPPAPIEKILFAYTCATFLFLILRLVNKSLKNLTENFLNIANGIVLVILLINFFSEIVIALNCQSTQYQMVNVMRDKFGQVSMGDCFSTLKWTFVLGLFFQLLFLRKKMRVSVKWTFTSLLLLYCLSNLDKAILLFKYLFFKDTLYSSWSTHFRNEWWLKILLSAIYFVICFSFAKWRKKRSEL